MPQFHHNIIGIGELCDHDARILFEKNAGTVLSQDDTILLKGWHEYDGSKLCRFSLQPYYHPSVPPEWNIDPHEMRTDSPTSINATDLTSVGALIRYLHAAAGFPVKFTWIKVINVRNYKSWPGLSYAKSSKYCPLSVK